MLACAQPLGLAPRGIDARAMLLQRVAGFALRRPQLRNLGGLRFEPAEGIDQAAVGRRLDQRALVMLAVDLHQRRADGLERLHAHRLVVDQGARAPVGKLHAAQNQLVLGGNVVRSEHGVGRMLARHVEDRAHLPLLDAVAHQAGVAAGAEREREGIEQDRLAGAGLAGEHREAGRELHVEALDQDDVADRKAGEHRCCRNAFRRRRHPRPVRGHPR